MAFDLVRTRFAPSPTGLLHVGNLRTALYSWLYARRHGGQFVLRLEDTDAGRNQTSATAGLLADLAWCGLDFDEGPGIGGPHGPYVQSERGDCYAAALARLREGGRVYPCFCSREQLEVARRLQLAQGRAPRYDGSCRRLPEGIAEARLSAGETASLRFRIDEGDAIRFTDLIRGEQRFERSDIGDFILVRSDGTPAFFFANALDDAQMAMSHVLRGDDHLSNTPRQLLVLEALQLSPPHYGHLPLVLGDDGSPLSKRHGAVSVAEFREDGVLPLALLNLLARTGHHYESEALLTLDALIAGFALEHSGRSAARFDRARLENLQRAVVAGLDVQAFWDWAGQPSTQDSRTRDIAFALRENVARPAEVAAWLAVLEAGPVVLEAEASEAIAAAGAAYFSQCLVLLDLLGEDFQQFTRELRRLTGLAGKQLYAPLRAALTGRLEGPELARLVPLMRREVLHQRFERFLS